ncbi:MAG: molybdopterin-dependent oxidoreductase [Candidatus Lokiarchaeota archaeon]|nr:molybdopterin-dependent oxidoreductase [Candidatus Lokiarchaeota archaeon]
MERHRTRRIAFITLFFLLIMAFPIPLIVFNLRNRNPELYSIRIEGNVSEVLTYTYEDIVDGLFGVVEKQEFVYLNQPPYNTRYNVIYTGVSVWSLLTHKSVINSNATEIFFRSYDAYYTDTLLLEKVENNPTLVIIAFKKDNKPLKYNSDDGGPLRAIVNLSVTEPDYCSKYWAKYVNTIVVV